MAKKIVKKGNTKAAQPTASVTKEEIKKEEIKITEAGKETTAADNRNTTEETKKMEKKEENVKTGESVIKRTTKETDITLGLRLYGEGKADCNTGIGFFDHMLESFAKHGNFDLKIIAKGDLNVDTHHTVEDVGIVLGQAIKKALESKEGINRYASFIMPMDDALVLASVDLCGRAYLNFSYNFQTEKVGYFETATVQEFFRAVSDNAGMNIHIKVLDGDNAHHIIEAMFKAFANALRIAADKSGRVGVLSTKGTI